MALVSPSPTPENPLIARASGIISDTYFLESWGLEGGLAALRNKVEWYNRLIAETEAFAETLTPEERAEINVMPARESAQSTGAA